MTNSKVREPVTTDHSICCLRAAALESMSRSIKTNSCRACLLKNMVQTPSLQWKKRVKCPKICSIMTKTTYPTTTHH